MLKFARRAYLKAVAGVWGLSLTDQLTISVPESEDSSHPDNPYRIHHSEQHEGLFIGQQGSWNTSIEVVIYPGHHMPVGVEVSFGKMAMGVALTPDEAEAVGQKIIMAATVTSNE